MTDTQTFGVGPGRPMGENKHVRKTATEIWAELFFVRHNIASAAMAMDVEEQARLHQKAADLCMQLAKLAEEKSNE